MNSNLIKQALELALADLQLISDQGENTYSKTIDLLIDALYEVSK